MQAELLSYRRLNNGMDWISEYFSMEELHRQLQLGEPLLVRYGEQDMLRPHCICGEFHSWGLSATLDDAIDPEVANLDIWDRATYGIYQV